MACADTFGLAVPQFGLQQHITRCILLQGIPPEHRPWVWMELSGGNKRRSEHMASYYEAMVDMGESSSEFTHQIELVGPLSLLAPHVTCALGELASRAGHAPLLHSL